MRCVICDQNDWEDVDQFRELKANDGKKVGMSLCKTCGFVSYPNKYKTKEEILAHYRTNYRPGPPTFNNFVTGERKLQYHHHFLQEVFKLWTDNKKEKPVIGEVGSALGMALNMFRQLFPKAEVHGTELTVDYRMVAFHEFGVRLGEELPDDRKYDLLMSYKVAEHQLDIDLELKKYYGMLKDDGYLYISVPTWFKELCNFGTGGIDLEYYYHPDHINAWTQKLFESLLKKTGFQIIKFDDYMYGETYLCKKTTPQELTTADYENPDTIKQLMGLIKEAFGFFAQNKFENALEKWPKFPVAWQANYEHSRQKLHEAHGGNGQAIADEICGRMRAALGESHAEIDRMRADIYMRYNMFGEAVEVIDGSLQKKPNQAMQMLLLAQCFRRMADTHPDPDKQIEYRLTARDICRKVVHLDRGAMMEACNWALYDNSRIPVDDFIDFVKARQKKDTAKKKGE